MSSPEFTLSAAELFGAHENMCLVTDRALTVHTIIGDRRLLFAPNVAEGMPLAIVAPELADYAGDLDDLLSGRLRKLEIGLSPRKKRRPIRHIWAQTVPVSDAGGQIVGVNHLIAHGTSVGLQRERCQREHREAVKLRNRVAQLTMDLEEARADLKRLDDAKSNFVSAASHELRNPLASLMGFLELLELEANTTCTPTQHSYLEGISRSAHRLRRLTNNLLDIARIDAHHLQLAMEEVDALDLVERAVSELQPLVDSKQQQLILKADPGLPLLWCDRERAMQVLVNLLSNAHKYTPQAGKITVQVGRDPQKPMLCITVNDTGIGIPLDDQYHLFTRFYRAANAGAADGAGAGLGLTISRSLVQLHGGELWFESRLGHGATFHVTFPTAE